MSIQVSKIPEDNEPIYGPNGQIIGTFVLAGRLHTPLEAVNAIEKDVKRSTKQAFPWVMLIFGIPWSTIIRFVIEYLSKRNMTVYVPMGYKYHEAVK